MRDFVKFVVGRTLKPALDDVTSGLEDARNAYRRQDKQQHFSKVSIQLRS